MIHIRSVRGGRGAAVAAVLGLSLALAAWSSGNTPGGGTTAPGGGTTTPAGATTTPGGAATASGPDTSLSANLTYAFWDQTQQAGIQNGIFAIIGVATYIQFHFQRRWVQGD
ncbi:MAG: hypothetical protein FWF28_06955 [Micrococcales bacterium]|nr:hypothetical protein [Micrococcales bacterium]